MNVGVVTICYNQVDTIRRLIKSVPAGDVHKNPRRVYLFSTSKASLFICGELAEEHDFIDYKPYGKNVGVSRCWNEGIIDAFGDGMDMAVIINDDCWFSPGDIDKLVEAALKYMNDPVYAISCSGFHYHYSRPEPSLGFACAVIMPRALEDIGCFDENIFPAYLEDCDYAYRASLLGLREENVQGTMVHHIGSATIFSKPALQIQNHITHTENFRYYKRKWGGINGEEVFTVPFNNPELGLRIAPKNRHEPYPGYNRTDHDIVKF